jgi:hypothetical protein
MSMAEEPQQILPETVFGNAAVPLTFKDALLAMPNVGDDADFEGAPQIGRSLEHNDLADIGCIERGSSKREPGIDRSESN